MRPALAVLLALGLTQCAPPPAPPAEPPLVAEEAVPDAQHCARPAEKQALLEAPTLADRCAILTALLEIDGALDDDEPPSLQ